jgi:hypothetical protein
VFTFFIFIRPGPYSPNGNSHLDYNASIDADFLKEVPFGGVEIVAKPGVSKWGAKGEGTGGGVPLPAGGPVAVPPENFQFADARR